MFMLFRDTASKGAVMKKWIASLFFVVCFFPIITLAEERPMGATNKPQSDTSEKSINPSVNAKGKEEVYAKWEKVYEDKSMQVYVDLNSVQWADDRVGFWKMIDLNRKLNDGALSLWVVDNHLCGKKLFQRGSVIHYKGQYGSGKEISHNDNWRDIERIKPGSMDDVVDEYVCKLKH